MVTAADPALRPSPDESPTDRTAGSTGSTVTAQVGPQGAAPRLPVDRHWLRRLVRRHPPPGPAPGDASPARPLLVLAPMVDQSDLPFRLLCRRYGCDLAFTPMIHSRLLVESPEYRRKFLPRRRSPPPPPPKPPSATTTSAADGGSNTTDADSSFDRPLIAQLCGSTQNPDYVLQAAHLLAATGCVDGIDLNCGCPQHIARRGGYGAFLLEQPEELVALVRRLTAELPIPVSVKVRLLPKARGAAAATTTTTTTVATTDQEDDATEESSDSGAPSDDHGHNESGPGSCSVRPDTTASAEDDAAPQIDLPASLALYRRLVHEGGIHMLTVHGRTRHHKGHHVGPSDTAAIRAVVAELGPYVPVVANGSVASLADCLEVWRQTGCDAVMSSEAILEYPALFERAPPAAAAPTITDDDTDPGAAALAPAPRRSRLQLAREYLVLAAAHPPQAGGQGSGVKCVRMHLHRLLHADLQAHVAVRDALCRAKSAADMLNMLDEVEEIHRRLQHDPTTEELSWYWRHRRPVESGATVLVSRRDRESAVKKLDLADDAGECFASLFDDEEEAQ